MSYKRKKKKNIRGFLIFLIFVCLCVLGAGLSFIFYMETLNYHDTLTVEVGKSWPEAVDFLKDGQELKENYLRYASDVRQFDTTAPGTYDVKLAYLDKIMNVRVIVQDTTAPKGSVRDLVLVNPETVVPEDFIVEYSDNTKVAVRFASEPVLTESGTQEVVVILEDEGGNVTQLRSTLTVLVDREAPVIQGAQNLEVYVEDAVAYRSGITVTDDQDEAPTLTVDNSAVDLSTPGMYELTYIATDHAGNSSSQTVSVKVYPKKANHVDPEVIYAAADKLLAKFIRDDMTTRQKVEAIYCWVQMHNQYANHSDKDDWLQAAYALLQTQKGDCYSYFALNKLLLHRLGIPTIDVEKVKTHEGDSRHYWLLVSIDGGESYYHIDNVWSMVLCLVTDQQLHDFSVRNDNNCFNRDLSLYPATPEEKLPYSELPWNDPRIRNAMP